VTVGRLILVKHGKPMIEPDRPRSTWRLSDEGREAAARLAERLAPLSPASLFASAEPKAVETAEAMGAVLGLAPRIEHGFGAQRADENPFGTPETFEAQVAALFADPDRLVLGEETGADARSRFEAALSRHGLPGAETSVVVAHGRIITLWLSDRLGFEPFAFWSASAWAALWWSTATATTSSRPDAPILTSRAMRPTA
jgi:broad specificity phosphatase PhoE